ncbi:MAG: GH92 family glycosyl hydrolase [Bacteroidota bacterium]
MGMIQRIKNKRILNFGINRNKYLKMIISKLNCCILFIVLLVQSFTSFSNKSEVIWKIGEEDNSSAEFALSPDGYTDFLENNFGFEDEYYLINHSTEKNDFPYVLPGPVDTWGGTWPTSGWRTHEINILFGINEKPAYGEFFLKIELLDYAKKFLPLVKIVINEYSEKIQMEADGFDVSMQPSPRLNELHSDTIPLLGNLRDATPESIIIPIQNNILKKGGNVITITVLEGSWIMFDNITLEGPGVELQNPEKLFIREVIPANYEIEKDGRRVQPLLVNVEHLESISQLEVELDGNNIFKETVEEGNYVFEAPMPKTDATKHSNYKIIANGKTIEQGKILRAPQGLQTPADYVDTKIGTAHSRWMIAPGPWMPMSMVKISPDNQNRGWQAGYQPSFENIGTFSHIHEWTMGGLGMMPTNGALQTTVGDQLNPDSGYRSRIDKSTEEAPLGYYKVLLTDTDIWAEATATTRCGFFRYTFPKDKVGRVMIDLHIEAEYDYNLLNVDVKKVSDYRIEGISHQISPRPHVWSQDADQEYTVNFVIEFDQPIKNMGVWKDDDKFNDSQLKGENLTNGGVWVEFETSSSAVIKARTGISLVSIENASENLKKEIAIPFGWDYDAVVANQKSAWNDILSRLDIKTNNHIEKVRFYTNMYRSMCRNTWSDVNGEWMSASKDIQKFDSPENVALGCDAFWNTFWNLNQFWNLVTPEWSSRWVHSQLAMYDADGWLAKGPAGMKYIPVMVAEHEIPLIVGAYQMGIRDFDAEKALNAMIKMQTTPARHVAGGFAGNRDLISYLTYNYVPSDIGRFSNTLEYSFDDWTISQMAKALGKETEYKIFSTRGNWWRNAINPENGFAHMRETNGEFVNNFDPFRSGANHQYVEGNAWQLSYFVPQDIPGLISIMGEESFVERLDWGFTASEPWRYNAPNDQYWDYPVVQGNQQSMHFAFLFNWANHSWLTQKWSRSIIDNYYGYGVANAYLGDEDQGQMSSWFVMAAIGLFQMDGGCSIEPIYEIGSPLYEKITINLDNRYGRGDQFVIEARGASRKNKYIQSASLNGKPLETFWFSASELLKGGALILEMGPKPNKNWGKGIPNKLITN